MSRFAPIVFAVLTAGSVALLAQAPPAPAAPAGGIPAAPLQVTPPGAAPAAAPAQDPNALKWSADSIDYNAKPGEQSAPFTFYVTNVSSTEIAINSLRTSCGCTVAQLPTTPYQLMPGSNVPISVTMDLRGKSGAVTKTVSVDSSAGFKSLLVKVNIPTEAAPATAAGAPGMDRAKNIQNALADRQAVFKGDCASCHVEKGKGKMGQELYAASCGICHDAEHRAAMVPDLKVPRSQRDLAFWQKWIMEGKPGTLMPAFAQIHGGPLTQEQIDSLTIYLFQSYPKAPKIVVASPTASATPSPLIVPPAPPVKN